MDEAFREILASVGDLYDLSTADGIIEARDYVVSRLEEVSGGRIGAKVQTKPAGAPDRAKERFELRINDRMRIVFFELAQSGGVARGNVRHG